MADDPMLSLFDDTTSFLEELTNEPVPAPGLTSGNGEDFLGATASIGPASSNMMGNYQQISPVPSNGSGMTSPAQTQKLHHFDQYRQYNQPMSGMNNMGSMNANNMSMNMQVPSSPRIMSPPGGGNSQFGSPPPNSQRVGPQQSFPGYSMHNSTMASTNGQMHLGHSMPGGHNMNDMWSGTQAIRQGLHEQRMPFNQQPMAPHQGYNGPVMGTREQFAMSQQNAGLPRYPSQGMAQYPRGGQMIRMNPNMGNTANSMSMTFNRMSHPRMAQAQYQQNPSMMSQDSIRMMGGGNMMSQGGLASNSYMNSPAQPRHPTMQSYPGSNMHQIAQQRMSVPGMQMTSGQMNSNGQISHFSGYGSKPQQGMKEAPPLSHYPGSGPGVPPVSAAPYQTPPYQGPATQQPVLSPRSTPMLSPRPTVTPPSRTPSVDRLSHQSGQSQGASYGQSSLQQLEQLMPPGMSTAPSSVGLYNPVISSQGGVASSGNQSATVGSPMYHSPVSNYSNPGSVGSITSMSPGMVSINTSLANQQAVMAGVSQISPAPGPNSSQPTQQWNNMPQNNPHALNNEIMQLRQKIQEMCTLPNSDDVQEQLLQMQERLRSLSAQQQLMARQQGMVIGPRMQSPPHNNPPQQVQHFRGPRPQMAPHAQQPGMMSLHPPSQQAHHMAQHSFNQQQQPVMMGQPPVQIPLQSPGQVPVHNTTVKADMPPLQPGVVVVQHQQIPQPHLLPGQPNQLPQSQMPVCGDQMKQYEEAQKKQEKANKIIQEAIAKAKASGNTNVPSIGENVGIPTTIDEAAGSKTKKPKKEKKEKVKKEKKLKETKKSKKVKESKEDEDGEEFVPGAEDEAMEEMDEAENEKKKTKATKSMKPKKKKPPATLINMKKKRKKGDDSASDMEVTPPPSDSEENGLNKRRSGRHTKRKKYHDEVDLQLSDDNTEGKDVDVEGGGVGGLALMKQVQFFVENPNEEDAVIVEKILGMRSRKVHKENEGQEEEDEVNKASDDEDDVEEFYVKYKNFSYLHCEWKTADELSKDKRFHQKVKRYKMKRLQQNSYFAQLDEDDLFNPDYVEVDRVLCRSIVSDPESTESSTHYLVKWQSLPYEESTWELEQDVDTLKIQQYDAFKDPPPEQEWEPSPRPKSNQWKQITESPAYKNDNSLREYQLEGISWLLFGYFKRQNCILADEMGLGKTIQSITFLQEVHRCGVKGPYLIIVPLSTIANWQREFEGWTDMNVIVYHGTAPSRNMLQEYEMYYKDNGGAHIPDIFKFNALITTYELILSDFDILSAIDWRVCIIDEAHRLKNKNCKLMEGLRLFKMEHRVLLTGTPLQNNIEELFSLLNFLEPEQFSSQFKFSAEFGTLQTETQVEKLKGILKPMMLRRLKEDVEKSLAPKTETIVEVELTNIQKKYYRAILEKNFSFLNKGSQNSSNVPSLMNTMMELRKCCNHPYLVNGAEDKILEDEQLVKGASPERLFQAMVHACGKLVLIDKLLPKLKDGGHKVLIFSQMIRVLDILEDYLLHKKYPYERLDGRIRGNVRQEAIDRFSKPESDRFVFLLCTRAGGLGINLTAADTVIIYDSDWNPQNDIQAQARCHRIGQSKSVKVYRLITRNSYEREMFDRASMKLGLDKAVLQSIGSDKVNPAQQLSKKEIEDLLKKGAYGAVMDDDNDGDNFCEEDIDQILQRRTQVITIESEGKGSTFSKATFNVSANRSDINIDDPEFWQKWAKKADIDMDNINRNHLIIEEPRQRKQTARYGGQDQLDMSELESSSDSDGDDKKTGDKKNRKSRHGRRGRRKNDEDSDSEYIEPGTFSRAEFFRTEKNILIYGWGRWEDILKHARFKRRLTVDDVITITKAILLYSLQQYKGDERIKGFIWDLVNSTAGDEEFKNHSGLSAPVPRGRKGRKSKADGTSKQTSSGFGDVDMSSAPFDPDTVLRDEGYKKHLHRHSNKVLLRVRLLYYLKQEIIGDEADKVFQGLPLSNIDIPPPCTEFEPPTDWWDEDADRSLLIGVFKHGYERYALMRQDPTLCFLGHCGPPDGKLLLAEQNDEDDNEDPDDPEFRPANPNRLFKNDMDEDEDSNISSVAPSVEKDKVTVTDEDKLSDKLPFPTPSDMNTRLRRLITSYQRNYKRERQRREREHRKQDRTVHVVHDREMRRLDQKQRWTRREEADFYRVVSTFGVERDLKTKAYKWSTFRNISRLDKKYDETLTEYFEAFYHMCKRVCKRFKNEQEAIPPNNLYVDVITEERASRCIGRIDLLNKIREEILWHNKLDERLKVCLASIDMPLWWESGKHDLDLLIGAAKHGLARTDYHILYDPKLCFRDIAKGAVVHSNVFTAKQTAPINLVDQNGKISPQKTEEKGEVKSELKEEIKDEIKEEIMDEHIKTEDVTKPEVKAENMTDNDIENDKEVDDTLKKHSLLKDELNLLDAETDTLKFKEEVPKSDESATKETEDNSMDNDGPPREPTFAELLAKSYGNPALQWPKDRVIFVRLEHVCHCIEMGEWPTRGRISAYAPDSRADTPVGTPIPESSLGGDTSRCDTPDSIYKSEGLKMVISTQKRRGRRRKEELVERTDFSGSSLRDLFNTPVLSSDNESNLSFSTADRLHNGILGIDHESVGTPEVPEKKKRGRKRKVDKIAEQLAAMQRPESVDLDPESRISVINIEDGSRLVGEEAPKRKDLETWLDNHPGYMVDGPDAELEVQEALESGLRRRNRRPRVDPLKLDAGSLTGDENISVINRETGKKITGAKAPPLRHLCRWLEQNRAFDVDPKWAHLVKAKIKIPEKLKNRVLMPHEKRKRPGIGGISSFSPSDIYPSVSTMGALQNLASAGLLGSFPKLPLGASALGAYPFGAMPGLGLTNPMFANMASLGLLAGVDTGDFTALKGDSKSGKSPENRNKTPDGSSSSGAGGTNSPAFPFLYNPAMLYNPLFAQSMGQFSLPTSMQSFASLAHAGLMNGVTEADKDSAPSTLTNEQMVAEDLSMKPSRKEDGTDSPVKKSSHKKRDKRSKNKLPKSSPTAEDYEESIEDLSVRRKSPVQVAMATDSPPSDSPQHDRPQPEESPEPVEADQADNDRNVEQSGEVVDDRDGADNPKSPENVDDGN